MTKCLARSAINGLAASKKLSFGGCLFFQRCARLVEVRAEMFAGLPCSGVDHCLHPGVSPVKSGSRIEPRACCKQGFLGLFP